MAIKKGMKTESREEQVRFSFDIEPVAQARTRYTSRPYPHEYDPIEVKRFKRQVNAMATQKMQQLGLEPLNGALEVKMTAYRPIQKSISKIEHARRATGMSLPVVKPDADNYIKSFLDALNGVIWVDDALITDLHVKKDIAIIQGSKWKY